MKYLLPIALILLIAGLWAYTAYAVSEGANSPGTMANQDHADDPNKFASGWTNPNNAITSDDSKATVSVSYTQEYAASKLLKATNFGFSVPTGATIDGILVEVEKIKTLGSPVDYVVRIVKANDSLGTTNKANGTIWPTSDTYISYGSSSDLWNETWTATDINDIDFGVVVSVQPGTANNIAAGIDHIRITVYYTEAVSGSPQQQVRSGTIQVRSGTLIVK